MRRALIILSSLALAGALAVTLIGPASSATRRADLAVADLAEPPETAAAGATFRQTFAVVNQGARRAGKRTTTRFFLDQTPDTSAGRITLGNKSVGKIDGQDEASARARLTVPANVASGEHFLVGCADVTRKLREGKEGNNCRVAGQSIGIGLSRVGPAGPPGVTNDVLIDKVVVPIGRATQSTAASPGDPPEPALGNGDDERSTERRELFNIGGVRAVADCKRTTDGDGDPPDDPFNAGDENEFDGDGDEAKVLIYAESGNVTFNGMGESRHTNLPAGEGEVGDPNEFTGDPFAEAVDGGEGEHMAIAAKRDPDQTAPGDENGSFGVDTFAYVLKTTYIAHSNGTELIFTGYAGIDVMGAEDQCVFGGVLKAVNLGA